MQIYSNDNGYSDNKICCGAYLAKFRSRVEKTEEEPIEGTAIIEYEGQRYKIGSGYDNIDLDKTKKLTHKLCTLYAIGKIAQDKTVCRLVVGLPLNIYKNKELREQFRVYNMQPKINNIKIDGKQKTIIIDNVLVFGQGAAALYAEDFGRYKNTLIGVLDWGGLTVNYAIFEDYKVIPESMGTVNLGAIVLYNRIKTALNTALGYNVQDYEIPYMIKAKDNKISGIIKDTIEQHVSDIIKELRKANWSIETLSILGIGGGMVLTKDMIANFLPKIQVSQNPVYANAKGLYNVGRMVWRDDL